MFYSRERVVSASAGHLPCLQVYVDACDRISVVNPVIGCAATDDDVVGVAGIDIGIVAASSREVLDSGEVCEGANHWAVIIDRSGMHVDIDTHGAGVFPHQRVGASAPVDDVELVVIAGHVDSVVAISAVQEGVADHVVCQVVIAGSASQFICATTTNEGVVTCATGQDVGVVITGENVIKRRSGQVVYVDIDITRRIASVSCGGEKRGSYANAAAGVGAVLVAGGVAAGAAIKGVSAAQSFQYVVAGTTRQEVVSGISNQYVVVARSLEIFDAVVNVT